MSETTLRSVLSHGWFYRGEGNANIVLSLPKTHQILRIKKHEKPRTILEWFFKWIWKIFKWDIKNDIENERLNLEFYNMIMIPLIGAAYAHPASVVNTGRSEICNLDKKLLSFRPEHRKHKRLQFGMAALFQDCAFLSQKLNVFQKTDSTYAVEIKPKQGWIPLADRCFGRCQFCLNQYLKLNSFKIKYVSSYCPLDLFSGNSKRMTKAIKSLILNPQNNFRIFKDGTYCYGENVSVRVFYDLLTELFGYTKNNDSCSLIDDFCDLIEQALLKEFCRNDGCVDCDDQRSTTWYESNNDSVCLFTDANLPEGCVLRKILLLQKLNSLGLKAYCDILKALNKGDYKFNEWSYIDRFFKTSNSTDKTCLGCIIRKTARPTDTDDAGCSDLNLLTYLIAAIANDCSLMVTFRKIWKIKGVPKHFVIKVKDAKFFVNVGVFDLYPKPVSTISKHVKRNAKLQNLCASKQLM